MSFEINDNNDDVMNEINMTPLVDVMLVLLIIFIITIPVVQHAVKVELPRTSSSQDKTLPENLQLAVDIPAVLGYNALVRGNIFIIARMNRFAHDLHAYYVTGTRVTHHQGDQHGV